MRHRAVVQAAQRLRSTRPSSAASVDRMVWCCRTASYEEQPQPLASLLSTLSEARQSRLCTCRFESLQSSFDSSMVISHTVVARVAGCPKAPLVIRDILIKAWSL